MPCTFFLRVIPVLLLLWPVLAGTAPAATTPPAAAAPKADPVKAASVPWAEDIPWHAVLDRAAENGPRPILIDFYAQWCGPCKLMDAYVYNESAVIAELADVVTFKVDIDKPEYGQLTREFGITLLPTLVWCDERGREIDRFTGAVSAREFLEIVRAFRSGEDTFLRIGDLAARHPEDPGLLFDMARRHADRGNDAQARVLYRRVMNLRHRTAGSAVVDGMLGLAALEQKAGNRDSARDIARRSARAVGPDSPGGRESLMAVAAFQGTLPDTAGMLDTYRILIAQDDSDAAALEAYARCATAAGTDLEQASRYALRAVIMSDEDPRMMATLGRAYFKRNLYRKAIRWMDKAVQGAPENLVYRQELVHYRETLKSKPFLYRGRRR